MAEMGKIRHKKKSLSVRYWKMQRLLLLLMSIVSTFKEILFISLLTVPTKPDAGSSIAGGDPSSAQSDLVSSSLSLLKSLRFDYVWNTVFRVRYKIPSIRRVPRPRHYVYTPTLPRRTFVTRTTIYTIPIKLELKVSSKIHLTVLLVLTGLSVPAKGLVSLSLKPTGTNWKMALLICLLLGLFLHGATNSIEGNDRICVHTPVNLGLLYKSPLGLAGTWTSLCECDRVLRMKDFRVLVSYAFSCTLLDHHFLSSLVN